MSTCILTGAGSGIGRAIAYSLSRTEYFDSYVLLGRNEREIAETIEHMKTLSKFISVEFVYMDLGQPELIEDIVLEIAKEYMDIGCLLNVAGYTDPQALFTTSLESFEHTYKVNVFSPFVLIRECAKYMKDHGGKIINIASTAGMSPRPGWLSYSSSKAALISMSETLTAELAEYGIKVYCVSPGRCATKLRRQLAPDEDQNTIMQPEDVAEVICKLIDPKECCLDGQNIVIRKQV